jgi:hypothetical protein
MVWALCLTAASVVTIRAANDPGVTAAQSNGAWATPAGEFKILGARPELEQKPAYVGVEKTFRDFVRIIVMIDMFVMPAMIARPHQD